MQIPSFKRRLGGVLYEALTVAALWMLASAIITTLLGNATHGRPRLVLQGLSLLVISAYFLWCWTHGGQTLAMKTWRIRVLQANGAPLSLAAALCRYLIATAGMLLAGATLWWAWFDRDGQFMHDRLAGTRLVLAEK